MAHRYFGGDRMAVRQSEIINALEELVLNEGGFLFQRIVASIADHKWPELITSEWHNDLGADMQTPPILASDGKGKVLAASVSTGILKKIKEDAKKVNDDYPDTKVLIFGTPHKVTQAKEKKWAKVIKRNFDLDLYVISRQAIITHLEKPESIGLCRLIGIDVDTEPSILETSKTIKVGALDYANDQLKNIPFRDLPLISLRACLFDDKSKEIRKTFELCDIKKMLLQGKRFVLEAPGGRGKTTTLLQLANLLSDEECIPFVVDFPSWIMSGKSIFEYLSQSPYFKGLCPESFIKTCGATHFIFLINGWNEISDENFDRAHVFLRQLSRDCAGSGIIVATRAHYTSPPLTQASHLTLLPLDGRDRIEYLGKLDIDSVQLKEKLSNDRTLDTLTRTPLVLAGVTEIFKQGGIESIPRSKASVLYKVIDLMEKYTDTANQLNRPPLAGNAQEYLCDLASYMTEKIETTIIDKEARLAVNATIENLESGGQTRTMTVPQEVLDTLCKHHVLEKLDNPNAFRFQHHQFQELFAMMSLRQKLLALVKNEEDVLSEEFVKRYLNVPAWEEPFIMLAEDIGDRIQLDESEMKKAGTLLVKMALEVHPILAARLSRLCGQKVWDEVAADFSEKLRGQYLSTDQNDKDVALAAMIASGSPDFKDIIASLLSAEDMQTRLRALRCYDHFYLSSLGDDWQEEVRSWSESARVDFVRETLQSCPTYKEIENFALTGPSLKVKREAIEWTGWIGSIEDVERLLDQLSTDDLEKIAPKLKIKKLPSKYLDKVTDVLKKIYSQLSNPNDCLKNLISQASLGNVEIDKIKSQLEEIESPGEQGLEAFVVKPALNIVRKLDANWVSQWVVTRIASGELYFGNLSPFIEEIPDQLSNQWLEELCNKNLRFKNYEKLIKLLAFKPPKDMPRKVFSKLCELKRKIISAPQAKLSTDDYGVERQLQELFRATPPSIAISELPHLESEPDEIELQVMLDVFNSNGRHEEDLKDILPEELRQKLRQYFKNCLPKALDMDDPNGSIKADLASCLSRVGDLQDTDDLRLLVQEDIKRFKNEIASSNTGRNSQCQNYLKAITELDESQAEEEILRLIDEPLYDRESAKHLIQLAKTPSHEEEGFSGFKSIQQTIVGWRTENAAPKFDTDKKEKFSKIIKDKIECFIEQAKFGDDLELVNFLDFVEVLSVLNPKKYLGFVIESLLSSNDKWSWKKLTILKNLLRECPALPADTTLPLIEEVLTNVRENQSRSEKERLLRDILTLLPFIDDVKVGLDKANEIILEFGLKSQFLKDILPCLGLNKSDIALSFLLELAGLNGEHINDLGKEWFETLKDMNSKESKRILMSFIDPNISVFEQNPSLSQIDALATCIAEAAKNDKEIYKSVTDLCSSELGEQERLILSKVIAKLNTEDAVLAGLSLIDDRLSQPIPQPLLDSVMSFFLKQKTVGKSSSYTLSPQSSNRIRRKLFEMSELDTHRKLSTKLLLKKIDVLRVEYGKPMNEPWNPKFET